MQRIVPIVARRCIGANHGAMTLLDLQPDLDAFLRMGLAVSCALAVGLNRAHHGTTPHPNRLRVHVLVGLSACLLVLAAGHDPNSRSRAIQGVATGVGFLGAGEILVPPGNGRDRAPEVRGLTSAASIWFTAALGVSVACSTPTLAFLALALALITLTRTHGAGGWGQNNTPLDRNHGADAEASTERPPR